MNKNYLTLLAAITLTACASNTPKEMTYSKKPKTGQSIQIFLAGDSTMAIKADDRRPETGWGERLPEELNEHATVHNRAINGRSTKSFKDQGHWQTIVSELNAEDYVFIQFGHNDQKHQDPLRYTNPYTDYRANLIQFVADVRAKGATPILLSSIARRNYNEQGVLIGSHGVYPEVVRQVAADLEVPFIDMTLLSEQALNEMGQAQSQSLYLHLAPGEHPNYPDGVADNTHLNTHGAQVVANIVIEELCKKDLTLNRYLTRCN